MAKDTERKATRKKEVRHAYLVRSYDQALVPDDSAGYYFTLEEAEDVKRELEKRYSQYLFSIEEFVIPGNPRPQYRRDKR